MVEEEVSRLKKRLLVLLKKKAFKKGKFLLSSGKSSNYYLDGRVITLTPEGVYLVASIILDYIKAQQISAVGGPTLGADPIVGAIGALSHIRKIPLKTFIVRKAAKGHGMQRQIEGPALKKNLKVLLVDDVATTGKSLVVAKERLEEMGLEVKQALVVVDRDEGARENLLKVGCKLECIFSLADLGVR